MIWPTWSTSIVTTPGANCNVHDWPTGGSYIACIIITQGYYRNIQRKLQHLHKINFDTNIDVFGFMEYNLFVRGHLEKWPPSIGQSDRMAMITVETSHATFGDSITMCMILPKNENYLLHCKCNSVTTIPPQGKCYNIPQSHLAHEICNCRKIRCTIHLATYKIR